MTDKILPVTAAPTIRRFLTLHCSPLRTDPARRPLELAAAAAAAAVWTWSSGRHVLEFEMRKVRAQTHHDDESFHTHRPSVRPYQIRVRCCACTDR